MSRTPSLLSLLTVLMLPVGLWAAPPKPDFTNLPGYIKALDRSNDPQAILIRQEIADGPAALARERAAAQADGIPLDAAQLQHPLPPPDQNAAPLYQQLDALRHAKPLHLPLYADSLNGNYAYTPDQLAAVQAIIDNRHDVFDLLQQAASKPECVFTRNWSAGAAVLFPEFAGLREDARELTSESYLLASRGDYADAVKTQALGFNVARHAASDPTLISYLVGGAIDAITLNGLKNILYQAGPNAGVAGDVEATVAKDAPVLSLKYALGGEVIFALTTVNSLRNADSSQIAGAFVQGPVKPQSLTPDERAFVSNLLSAWEARYLSEMRPLIVAADAGPAARRSVFAAIPPAAPGPVFDPVTVLNNIIFPVFGKIDQKDNQIHAQAQVVMAAAAILAVKAQTGAFPAMLPGDFPDPFTGKPLGYRREGPYGFVVYSVGADGTFDGGKLGQYVFVPYQSFFRYPSPTRLPVPAEALGRL